MIRPSGNSGNPVDVLVLGGGPAGTAAAREAARIGASVAIVGEEELGGRARWHSLLPSKVWLNAANLLGDLEHSSLLGIPGVVDTAAASHIVERVAEVKDRQYALETEEFDRLHIEQISGTGQFTDPHTVEVRASDKEHYTISADKIIIASGSVPIFPDGMKPDGKRILAPRFLSKLQSIPKSMIVVGGGVTGSEIIYLFNRLGTEITAITDITELLPRSDMDVSRALESILSDRGVDFHKGVPADRITRDGDAVTVSLTNGQEFSAEYAFVAIGRKPDVQRLDLEKAGIEYDPTAGVKTESTCLSSVEHIFAAGDVTGAPMTANRAMAQGRIAARNAVGKFGEEYYPEWTIEAVYTEPEVAQVGLLQSQATDDVNYTVLHMKYQGNLKAEITEHRDGFLKLLVGDPSGVILGASAVGYHAGDLLAPIAVAIRAGMSYEELHQVALANPTLSEIITSAPGDAP